MKTIRKKRLSAFLMTLILMAVPISAVTCQLTEAYTTSFLISAEDSEIPGSSDTPLGKWCFPGVTGVMVSSAAICTNGFSLALVNSPSVAFSQAGQPLIAIAAVILILLILVIFYLFWIKTKVLVPLKKLAAWARLLSPGKHDAELLSDISKEIGPLSGALGDIYEKMSEYSAYTNTLAYRDPLTGVKNSAAYAEAISEIDGEIHAANAHFSVLVADINHLKKTNDTYGHDIGNELIVRSARILANVFNDGSVFRIGGDEFVVILKETAPDSCQELIEKMDTSFSEEYIHIDGEKIPVSIARGIAVFELSVDRTYSDVFEKADRAMYAHKNEMKVTRV